MVKEFDSIKTKVGKALFVDHIFCGYSVARELLETETFWSTLSMAVGGRRLSASESQLFDKISTVVLGADPRIWPLKISRLVSSFGSTYAGVSGVYMALEGSNYGPFVMAAASRMIKECVDSSDYKKVLRQLFDNKLKIPGFGVPIREMDERVLAIRGYVKKTDLAGKYLNTLEDMEDFLLETKGLRVNIGGYLSALLLDFGYQPEQIGILGPVSVFVSLVANSYEESVQQNPQIQYLREDDLEYVGPAKRTSERGRG
jgi:citrate synthase